MQATRTLSIDISGLWSPRQAEKVIEALKYEAMDLGLRLVSIDITSFGMPYRRRIIVARCAAHGCIVLPNSVCSACRYWHETALAQLLKGYTIVRGPFSPWYYAILN